MDGGLGVHATLDLYGNTRFGPDVEWLPPGTFPDAVDFAVDPSRADGFYAAIRRYWPTLQNGKLHADYAGCRPKLSGPGIVDSDFLLQGPEEHGIGGLVNLYGIESPGLTSSLAIGDRVARMLG